MAAFVLRSPRSPLAHDLTELLLASLSWLLCSAWHFRFRQQLRPDPPPFAPHLSLWRFLPSYTAFVGLSFMRCICALLAITPASWSSLRCLRPQAAVVRLLHVRRGGEGDGDCSGNCSFGRRSLGHCERVCFLSCLPAAETYAHI